NRAVARAELDGPRAALADLAPLEADKRMIAYQPYSAARGHLLSPAGDTAAAAHALTVSSGTTTDAAATAARPGPPAPRPGGPGRPAGAGPSYPTTPPARGGWR